MRLEEIVKRAYFDCYDALLTMRKAHMGWYWQNESEV